MNIRRLSRSSGKKTSCGDTAVEMTDHTLTWSLELLKHLNTPGNSAVWSSIWSAGSCRADSWFGATHQHPCCLWASWFLWLHSSVWLVDESPWRHWPQLSVTGHFKWFKSHTLLSCFCVSQLQKIWITCFVDVSTLARREFSNQSLNILPFNP